VSPLSGTWVLCMLVRPLMALAGRRAARLKSQSGQQLARATVSAPSSAPSLGVSLLMGARFGLLARGSNRSGRGEPPLRPEVSTPSKPRAAPIQVGVTTPPTR
jgi:hypothetical protein